MVPRLLVAALLLGHALIHLGFVSPRPPATAGGPAWPFELSRSWLLDALGAGSDLNRLVGTALIAVTVAGFALAVLAAVGVMPTLWAAGIAAGAVGSLGVLVLFFHPWLTLGLAIDLALLWVVLVARWTPESLAA